MKAKAIIFVQPGRVELGEVGLAAPTGEDIVIETEVSGISVGTERWAYLGKRAELTYPNVPGYMAVGKMTASGAEARRRGWQEGERVYFFRSRFEKELDARSWMGSHVEKAVVNVCGPRGTGDLNIHHCEKIPAGLPSEEAVLTGLCGVALRGIEMAGIPAGAKVLICGLGVIGQYALQVCQLKGAEVSVTDVVGARLEIARQLGAANAIDGRSDDLAARAGQIAPAGFDVIIDTSSVIAVVNGLFPLLKLGGKFIFQGWYPPPSSLDLNALHMRLPTAYFPCAHSAEAVGAALRLAAQGWLRSALLITHTFRPEEAPALYSLIAEGSENFLGMLIDWRNSR